MITRIKIQNFQSLHDIDLAMAGFVVIVGPSSVGKSALVRAIRALVSNVRGTSTVARGQGSLQISAELGDLAGHQHRLVTLRRGKTNEYTEGVPSGTAASFTKIGSAVPAEITEVLGIPADGGLSFAGQFDPPFLLDETGSAVARALGQLTNVDVLYSAAREANRRRLSTSTTLKLRQGDLSSTETQLKGYANLDEQVERHQALVARTATLSLAKAELMAVLALLSRVSTARDVQAGLAEERQLPDPARAQAAWADYHELTELLRSVLVARTELRELAVIELPAAAVLDGLRTAAQDLHELEALLVRVRLARGALARLGPAQQLLEMELGQAQAVVDALQETCPYCGASKNHWNQESWRSV